MIKLTQAPRIETDRLVLREFRVSDLDSLAKMWAKEKVVRFIGGARLSREDVWRRCLAACAQWPLTGFGYWIAELKDGGTIAGQLGFADFKRDMQPSIEGEPELGYVFDPSFHGRGLAFEGCSVVLEWGDLMLAPDSYPAIIDLQNLASISLAEKLGFVRQPNAIYREQPVALYRRPGPLS
jgi:RimJ/RimL family protein N-acetyltransferase